VKRCIFCGRPASGDWALTSCLGDPADPKSWQRSILPVCTRCNRLLGEAGREGRVHKATGVRWFAGHTAGRIASKWTPGEPP